MACGVGRVTWAEFYAAISRAGDRRASFNGQRMTYRFGDRQGGVDPSGYPYPESRGGGRGGVVEFPPGFAPVAGANAIFTPLDPRVAALDAHSEPAAVRAGNQPLQDAPLPERKPGLTDPPGDAPQTAESVSQERGIAPIETASTDRAPDAGQPQLPAAAPANPGASMPVAPTILNNPAAQQVREAVEAPPSGPDTVIAATEMAPAPAAEGSSSPSVFGWEGTARLPDLSVSPLMIALGIAVATLGVLFTILKRQAAMPMGPMPAVRGSVEPVLPGFGPSQPSLAAQSLVVRQTPDVPGPPNSPSSVADQAGEMPVTRADALATLGLSPDASEAVVRKVVEGLRQSWHPDLASGEADRVAREERLKRINVAAGILLRRPAA